MKNISRKLLRVLLCTILLLSGCTADSAKVPDNSPAPEKGPGQSTATDTPRVVVKPVGTQLTQATPSLAISSPRPTPPDTAGMQIVIYKADRVMEVWDGTALLHTFPVGLGFTPEGHKAQEGDGRTPEGSYYVCVRNDRSRFYLSLGLSYPNIQDAEAGMADGRIDRDTYDDICQAIEGQRKPPWNTALGGEIMIHGMGGDRDWTAGCIAVDNGHMDTLWDIIDLGTPVTIFP